MSKNVLKYDPWPTQDKMLDHFKQAVNNDKKFILIDSPVGTGKSFGAIMMFNWYKENKSKYAKADFLSSTKVLQTQYTEDFPFMNNLWGRNNYFCEKYQSDCSTGAAYNKALNKSCKNCPYQKAIEDYKDGTYSITNFHMYNSFAVYVPQMLDNRNSNILFIDEAHLFEKTFCDFIKISLSKKALDKAGIEDSKLLKSLKRVKNLTQAKSFIESILLPRVQREINKVEERLNKITDDDEKFKVSNTLDELESLVERCNVFIDDENQKNWVFQKQYDQVDEEHKVTIEPTWATPYFKYYLWGRYDHIVCMSGTILDEDAFCKIMSIDKQDASYLSLDMPFDKENRQIYYRKVGKMSYKHKDETLKSMAPVIEKIMEQHEGEKGIIHTGNYDIAHKLNKRIKSDRFKLHSSYDRDIVLNQHLEDDDDSILVSPSMFTGVDLKDDHSRFQIIAKIPFPNLGSQKIKKRMNMNPKWYTWQTLNDLIQAYGRSTRNHEDYSTTYILDQSFDYLMYKAGDMVPDYFKDAVERI